MKTIEAELILMEMFDYVRNTVVPNVTDQSGLVRFETDMLILSKSRYATGVEIKVSKSDLKNDLKKKHIKAITKPITKYSKKLDKDFYFNTLKYFYYAVPKELIPEAKKQIPDFCGLINLSTKQIIKTPSLINNKKWSVVNENKLKRLGCLRIYNLKKNILKFTS